MNPKLHQWVTERMPSGKFLTVSSVAPAYAPTEDVFIKMMKDVITNHRVSPYILEFNHDYTKIRKIDPTGFLNPKDYIRKPCEPTAK